MGIIKIVSGGQTGVDRAAIDIATELGIEIGGWVPKGRLAEDGRISERYSGLSETVSEDPGERTKLNVHDSDGTLIISRGPLSGGSDLTREFAKEMGRPYFHVDLSVLSETESAVLVNDWIERNKIKVLNIAGPRASEDPEIYLLAGNLLDLIFRSS